MTDLYFHPYNPTSYSSLRPLCLQEDKGKKKDKRRKSKSIEAFRRGKNGSNTNGVICCRGSPYSIRVPLHLGISVNTKSTTGLMLSISLVVKHMEGKWKEDKGILIATYAR